MDLNTLGIVQAGLFALTAFALFLTWRVNKAEDGTRDWALGGLSLAAGALILGVAVKFTLLPMLILGNLAAFYGYWAIWIGIRRYLLRPVPARYWLWTALAVFTLSQFMVSYDEYWHQTGRALVATIGIGILSAFILFEMLRASTDKALGRWIIIVGFAVNLVVLILRMIEIIQDPFTYPKTIDLVTFYILPLNAVALTYGMILMTTERLQFRLRHQAATDPLTGAFNRRAFELSATSAIAQSIRQGTDTALAMLDLDKFKLVNDTHGHQVGDEVLKGFVEVAQKSLREQDILARFGGEEFVAVLPGVNADQAKFVIDRVRDALSGKAFEGRDGSFKVTTSAGIADVKSCSAIGGKSDTGKQMLESLIAAADQALYQAKESGRNRSVVATVKAPNS